jgi:hypothetical protein
MFVAVSSRTSLRMLVLMPLLAVGIDVTRATTACGAQAQTCLEAAGRGWLGPVAVLLVIAYALGIGVAALRALQPGGALPTGRGPSFLRLWGIATAGLALIASGQLAFARIVGDGAPLGGSPAGVLALCVCAGAVLALLVRLGAEAAEAVAGLARAPRASETTPPAVLAVAVVVDAPRSGAPRRPRGRAPPTA